MPISVFACPRLKGFGLGQVHALGLESSRAPVPISVFWLVPQYCIIGAAEILVNIGTMELFYSEVLPSPYQKRVVSACACLSSICEREYTCLHVLEHAVFLYCKYRFCMATNLELGVNLIKGFQCGLCGCVVTQAPDAMRSTASAMQLVTVALGKCAPGRASPTSPKGNKWGPTISMLRDRQQYAAGAVCAAAF